MGYNKISRKVRHTYSPFFNLIFVSAGNGNFLLGKHRKWELQIDKNGEGNSENYPQWNSGLKKEVGSNR